MLRHQSIHNSPFNFSTTLSLDGLLNGSIFVMGVIMCFILVGVVHFTNKAASRDKISELPQTIQQQQNPLNTSLLQSPIVTVAETLTTCSVSPPHVSSLKLLLYHVVSYSADNCCTNATMSKESQIIPECLKYQYFEGRESIMTTRSP
ncbi:hypothetical protein Naga_100039g11 [Nannochloropsis gaditana]|uniref:Uncharacterized protein n=1 Tax=Nannochloropsis gaditana TaxID=72520 RepID=W7T504_9STRA|nr:hypothetical protein Naga_100039g11 [Nannochloropsis gaditana]